MKYTLAEYELYYPRKGFIKSIIELFKILKQLDNQSC